MGEGLPANCPVLSWPLGGVGRALAVCPVLLGRQKECEHHNWGRGLSEIHFYLVYFHLYFVEDLV